MPNDPFDGQILVSDEAEMPMEGAVAPVCEPEGAAADDAVIVGRLFDGTAAVVTRQRKRERLKVIWINELLYSHTGSSRTCACSSDSCEDAFTAEC